MATSTGPVRPSQRWTDPTTGDLRLDSFIGRAQAAVAALEGDFDEAARIAAHAGRLCVAGTYVNFGAVALYDAVRCGRADLVVDDLGPLDVVELAVAVRTSKAIAEALFLSARTVDNHLAQVYQKLAVQGRAHLAEALAPLPPSPISIPSRTTRPAPASRPS